MPLDVVQLAWIACGLFYAMEHAVMAIITSNIPSDVDKAIEYLEWLIAPLNIVMIGSSLSLIAALGLFWAYCIGECSASGYIVAGVVTPLGLSSHFGSRTLQLRVIVAHLRSP